VKLRTCEYFDVHLFVRCSEIDRVEIFSIDGDRRCPTVGTLYTENFHTRADKLQNERVARVCAARTRSGVPSIVTAANVFPFARIAKGILTGADRCIVYEQLRRTRRRLSPRARDRSKAQERDGEDCKNASAAELHNI